MVSSLLLPFYIPDSQENNEDAPLCDDRPILVAISDSPDELLLVLSITPLLDIFDTAAPSKPQIPID